MDLFLINRYNEDLGTNDPNKEQKILEKLQKNIEEKKRKKKKKIEESVVEVTTNHVEPETQMEVVEEETNEFKHEPETAPPKPQTQTKYVILGDDTFEKRKKTDMILPPWLAYPTILPKELSERKAIKDLIYITKQMKTNLKNMKVETFFPVQYHVIPWILHAQSRPTPFRPRDICVSAPTGSGKTLAFAVPIVQILQSRVERKIRALVVLPVHELAAQVAKVFREMCSGTNVICSLLSTTVKFANEQKQIMEEIDGKYYPKADIIVTTAGRLVEHIHSTKGFSLKHLRFLVIDEADRVMQEIQNDWLYHINKHVQEESAMITGRSTPLNIHELWNDSTQHPHKLLFSATLSPDPESLKVLNLFQPKLFTNAIDYQHELISKKKNKSEVNDPVREDFIGHYTTPSELTQKYCLTEMKYRPLSLFTLIKENNWKKFLCFTNNKNSAHRLSFLLQFLFRKEMIIEELSSVLSAKQRQTVLDKFANGSVHGLVCSDALARGIDIPDVEVVISYDPAYRLPTYIHRIGRTARAGKPGTAVTIVTFEEFDKFMNLIKTINNSKIEEITFSFSQMETLTGRYTLAMDSLNEALRNEKQINFIKGGAHKLNKLKSNKVEETESKELSLFEKLQSNLPQTKEIFRPPLQKPNYKNTVIVPGAWNQDVKLNKNRSELENEKKKEKKMKRKAKLKLKFNSLTSSVKMASN